MHNLHPSSLWKVVIQKSFLNLACSFRHGLANSSAKKKSETKVLVCNGAADPFVTAPQIETFKKTMKEADIAFTFENYDGATHGFTNQGADEYGKKFGLPLAYHPEADKASWKELESFLAELFKSEE